MKPGRTKIAYCPGATVGGIHGCTPIPGPDGSTESGPCARCWAEACSRRFGWGDFWARVDFEPADQVVRTILAMPAPKPEQRLTFAWPMADPLHETIPIEWLGRAVLAMAARQDRTWLLLSKRHSRYSDLVRSVYDATGGWPENVWIGMTAWDHDSAYHAWACYHRATRWLQAVPVQPHVRWWMSIEPLLGPIPKNMDAYLPDWVVVGCESGPGARPCPTSWIESIVLQCSDAGVPVWAKQARANRDGTGALVHRPEILGRKWEERL